MSTDVAIAISIPTIISKKLATLIPIIKIRPFTIKIIASIKMKCEENKWKFPNNQKHSAIKISKTPNILMNIIFLN
jgi:hypothetical protein